jgi:hypothetical protein
MGRREGEAAANIGAKDAAAKNVLRVGFISAAVF